MRDGSHLARLETDLSGEKKAGDEAVEGKKESKVKTKRIDEVVTGARDGKKTHRYDGHLLSDGSSGTLGVVRGGYERG